MAEPLPPPPQQLDTLPTPPSTASVGSEPVIIEGHEEEAPTASHALAKQSANDDGEPKGMAQIEHGDVEVRNLGWNEEAKNVPQPVVGGLKNEELWTLVRRFDKQIFHVRRIHEPPLADLDMNIADDGDFSPDKLRAQLERLYMVVIVSLFSAWKQLVRLRSWKEYKRTSAFLGVYTIAWLFDLLAPTLVAFLTVLVVYSPSRDFCFPPAPPSLIDSRTGGIQKPPAGVLASDDSVTGAPEKHQGEAVEQEAHSFVNSISSLVVSTAAGKHPQGDPHEDNSAPDPTELTTNVADAKEKTRGGETTVEHDRTRQPVSRAVWDKARPALHMIADLADTWERFGNALSPTAPFSRRRPKLVLGGVLLPILIASYFTTSYMMVKGLGFGFGFSLFGDPIITPAIAFANRTYPRWQKFVELRNTILKGVPTNAQLAITLLRIGESNKAPIPPPPTSDVPPDLDAHPTAGDNIEHLGADDAEIQAAVKPTPAVELEQSADDKGKPKKSHRILNLLKGTTKGGVKTALTADKAKAAVGAHHARDRLGVVKGSQPNPITGPIRFPARYKGKKGHVYVTSTATTPAVSWTSNIDDVDPAWTVSIAEVEELKKVGGLGWKTKLLVGWAMGKEVVDGLVVKTRDGRELHITAVFMRDELFNRLISMGSQMWEAV